MNGRSEDESDEMVVLQTEYRVMLTMKVKIREMQERDIPSVVKILRKITKKDMSDRWKSQALNYLGKGNISVVAESNGNVVGFMFGTIREWMFGVEKSGWIEILGVEPEYMGKGIGKELGETMLKKFRDRGATEVYTSALWHSGDMLAYFKSLGFSRSELVNLNRKL